MASAVTSTIVRSHHLPKGKRLVRSIVTHAKKHYSQIPQKPMVRTVHMGLEDVMISLGGQLGLSKQKLFEYIKVSVRIIGVVCI
jgi:hypothetical protein